MDISKSACVAARKNLHLNWFSSENYPVIEADVFTYLRRVQENFSMIILDPPAFAKNKRDVTKATRGYKEINLQAVKHLTAGGMLATFSCSNFIRRSLFLKIVLAAARDAGADLQLLARLGGQGRITQFYWDILKAAILKGCCWSRKVNRGYR